MGDLRVRILMVTNTYAPARNGVATWAALSVRELRAIGHDVTVLTFRHDLRARGEEGLAELPAWAGIDSDFKVGPVPRDLPVASGPGDWDLVHVHHPVLLGPAGVRIGRRAGARVVFTCHSVYTDYADEYYWGALRFTKDLLTRRVRRFADSCDQVLVPASRTGRWLRDVGVSSPVALLDTPADTTRIARVPREQARAALGLGDERVALYVGRIADEKRVGVLVDEFRAGCGRLADARLFLVGTGVRTREVGRRIRRLGLEDRAQLLGPMIGDDLALWYSAADVAVSASQCESGPLTVVEAMSCGCPNVAFKAPGFEDRIVDGENGLLAEDRPGALGEAIARVLEDDELRARLRAGALACSVAYTPEANVHRMLDLYTGADAPPQIAAPALIEAL